MNREIKFRYWNGVTNQMVNNPEMPYKKGWTIEQLFSDRGWVWQQYTGLKDKNGVEIYEGDVVKADFPEMVNEEPYMHGPELYHREVVVAEKKEVLGEVRIRPVGGTGMIVRKISILKDNNDRRKREEIMKNTEIGRFLKIRQNKDEVIGNIYENPELLEEDK